MVVADVGSHGRLRRLTQAAIHADSAIVHAEEVAIKSTQVLDDLGLIVERLEPSVDRLDDLIDECRREIAGIGNARRDIHSIVEQIGRIFDLIEWALTPAYVARDQITRVGYVVADVRRTLIARVGPPQQPLPQPIDLAEVRRLAG